MGDRLDNTITVGNRRAFPPHAPDSTIPCTDGFTMSVIAGNGCYSRPRTYPGPYTAVEVGFPSSRPEPWDLWQQMAEDPDDPCGTVYSYVPVGMVRDLVESHGGEA